MRQLPAISAAAFLFLAACGQSMQGSPPENPLAGHVWTADAIGGAPALADHPATLELTPDGQVSGHAGCNGYFGTATLDEARISFGQIATTNMACPDPQMQQEGRYHTALATAESYRIEGDTLLLLDGAGTTLVHYRR